MTPRFRAARARPWPGNATLDHCSALASRCPHRQQRIKPHKRIRRDKPEALAVPLQKNEAWSMDFMSDSLDNGRKFRTFNVIDDYNREGLCVDVDFSLPSARVIRSLEQVFEWRGKPRAIRCDNGPEYVSAELEKWAKLSHHRRGPGTCHGMVVEL